MELFSSKLFSTSMMESPLLLLLLGATVAYYTARSIYRLYFHPLSKIPGPKLAIITRMYEFYYDVIKGGKFLFQIQKIHEQYGPIVRINPHEIHINDPTFYDEIYASGGRKRDKYAQFLRAYTIVGSMAATVDHDHHRYRRNILSGFFSKRSVNEISPVIEGKVLKLMERFERAYRAGSIIRIDDAYSALASDVITQYAFGKSWGFLDDDRFNRDMRRDVRSAIAETSTYVHINRFIPLIPKTLESIPPWLATLVQPGRASLSEFTKSLYEFTAESKKMAESSSNEERNAKKGTIFEKLTDPSLPPEERTFKRVFDETGVILQAGTESIGRALTLATFYLAHDPSMWKKLREELRTILPTPTSRATWAQLEQLPYLTGVVTECLRLEYGLTIRLPRCAPKETLVFNDYVIPPGTPMSMSTYLVHHDENIFPDSHSFKPERWIGIGETDRLTKYMVSFSRGSRTCLGMNLSYLVLYTTIATLVRRFDMELHKTELEDVKIVRDYGLGITRNGEVQVFTKVTKMLED